jgi:hypothetical protein
MATSRVDDTHPSWYPMFLKELESKYPDVYQDVTSTVVGRNAERQVREQSARTEVGWTTMRHCEEFAVRGTGYGMCDAPLDAHGTCARAGDHRDSVTLREL